MKAEEQHWEEEMEMEMVVEYSKPIGDVVKVTGEHSSRREHYEAFEFHGRRFELEDTVLLIPKNGNWKPDVAMIKDIIQTEDGSIMVIGQWFYRPEEAEKKGSGTWEARDNRELFYSFHRVEVPVESVMHKCVVHFIPLGKQLPKRKEHPGFIVQMIYDNESRKVFKLSAQDHEIDLLFQKTMFCLGNLPDLDLEDASEDLEAQIKSKSMVKKRKRSARHKFISPLDVPRENEGMVDSNLHLKEATPGSCLSNATDRSIVVNPSKDDKKTDSELHGLKMLFQQLLPFRKLQMSGGPPPSPKI